MPTPFYHLSLAEAIAQQPSLPPKLRQKIIDHWPAFLLGNTAPDVQTITHQDRRQTHFFDIPIFKGEPAPWERMFRRYPVLTPWLRLPEEQAIFLLGYFCHLLADVVWVQQIFFPIFGPFAGWQTMKHRLYLHNVLRSYLDYELLPSLPGDLGQILAEAIPSGWLPFVEDRDLEQWRDFVSSQLLPGASVHTVEVFAARQGISPDEYYRLIQSEERLNQEIFQHLPRQTLAAYRQQVIEDSTALLASMG